MAVVFQGIEGEKKGRMVIGCASVLRLGHGNTKTLLSFFPNNIGAKHFLRAKALNSSNLTFWYVEDQVITKKEPENKRLILKVPIVAA